MSENQRICRYWRRGVCWNGNRCRFSHSPRFALTTNTANRRTMNAGERNTPVTNDNADINEDYYSNVAASLPLEQRKLCPTMLKHNVCKESNCGYIHPELCDYCGKRVLHPFNEDQRKEHINECILLLQKDIEYSFVLQESCKKICGVCLEVVNEKTKNEKRFGLLPNCNHCFCLTCIRRWRQSTQFDKKATRSCPECRTPSNFVCPSKSWPENEEEKNELINKYQNALSQVECKYFKKGFGKCPFGNKCFYLHALPDGSKCDVGPPPRRSRREYPIDIESDNLYLMAMLIRNDSYWNILDDILSLFSDSDDSDLSEFEIFF